MNDFVMNFTLLFPDADAPRIDGDVLTGTLRLHGKRVTYTYDEHTGVLQICCLCVPVYTGRILHPDRLRAAFEEAKYGLLRWQPAQSFSLALCCHDGYEECLRRWQERKRERQGKGHRHADSLDRKLRPKSALVKKLTHVIMQGHRANDNYPRQEREVKPSVKDYLGKGLCIVTTPDQKLVAATFNRNYNSARILKEVV